MNEVKCLQCEHFRMWDGDPCCLEPNNGWKIVLPDITRDCNSFKLRDREDSDENNIWEKVWNLEKEEFFKDLSLEEPNYSKYMSEHPEYEGKIKKIS